MTRYDETVRFALDLADRARRVLRECFRAPLEVETKPDATPVTAADREVEALIRDRIARAYPADGILGEEHGAERLDAERVWVIDPIDGTKAFASGKPLFGTLIGLVERGRPVLGIIECPAMLERWLGVEGRATLFNGEPVRVRAPRELSAAVLYTAVLEGEREEGYRRLKRAVRWTVHDADCYAYGLLARGDVDLVVEADLDPSDQCALVPVVQGAGGYAAAWSGAPIGLDGDGTLVAATSAELAAAAVRILER